MKLPPEIYSYLGEVDPALLQGIIIGIGVFFTAVLIGISRRYLISSSLQGVWAGFIIGVIVLVGIEAGILWGMKSVVTGERAEILPQGIRTLLSDNQRNLTQVLGIQTERERPTAQTVIVDYDALASLDEELVKSYVCKEEAENTVIDD